MIPAYPKVWHVGHRAIPNLFDGEVVVQEKVDGSQVSFAVVGSELHVRSKNQELVLDNADMFQLAVEQIRERQELLVPNAIYRGEYLSKPKHNTLKYDRVPEGNIALFDVQYEGIVTTPLTIPKLAGFDVVPTLYEGLIAGVEDLNALLEKDSFLGGTKVEGVVVKSYDRLSHFGNPSFGKYVSEAFKEAHSTDWKNRNPNGKDMVGNVIEMYRTEARWEKAVQHLREDGELQEAPQDIGPLMKAVALDVLEEERENIKDYLFHETWKQIQRGITSGLPQWYKDRLAEQAFGQAS